MDEQEPARVGDPPVVRYRAVSRDLDEAVAHMRTAYLDFDIAEVAAGAVWLSLDAVERIPVAAELVGRPRRRRLSTMAVGYAQMSVKR